MEKQLVSHAVLHLKYLKFLYPQIFYIHILIMNKNGFVAI